MQVYREAQDKDSGKVVYCLPSTSVLGPLHGVPLSTQYKSLDAIDQKRLAARRQNTTYCYDFPLVCHPQPYSQILFVPWFGPLSYVPPLV